MTYHQIDAKKVLAKLDRVPAGHNWVRCIDQTVEATTRKIVGLALGFPVIQYRWAIQVIAQKMAFGLDDNTARKQLLRSTPEKLFSYNSHVLEAFIRSDEANRSGIQVFDDYKGFFLAGSDVSVPVSPTIILRENGKLTPVFCIPWADIALSPFQASLLWTVYNDVVLSLTDFLQSPARTLWFPREAKKSEFRTVVAWERDQFPLLTTKELADVVRIFVEAREAARPLIVQKIEAANASARSKYNSTAGHTSDAAEQEQNP